MRASGQRWLTSETRNIRSTIRKTCSTCRGGPMTASTDLHSATAVATGLADELDVRLAAADGALVERFPGARPGRQPVHTVYVPADRYSSDLEPRWGGEAVAALDQWQDLFGEVTEDATGELTGDLMGRVRVKLEREPIEDLRIDFEDGYGVRPDDVEDKDVLAAAGA